MPNKNTSFIIISLLFLIVIYGYRFHKLNQIDRALSEHALVIAEPMWNFDSSQLTAYLNTVTDRYNYHKLQVFDENNAIFIEIETPPINFLDHTLIRIGLIPLLNIEKEIHFEENVIGTIRVVWQDTSIYFCSYAFLVSLLLGINASLYFSLHRGKLDLQEKIYLKEEAMAELQKQKEYVENIFNVVPEGLITIDKNNKEIGSNRSFESIVAGWATTLSRDKRELREIFLTILLERLKEKTHGHYPMTIDNTTITIEYSSSRPSSFSTIDRLISLRDTTKITSMERQLLQAQKLESVGRLASGIAHEINTPTQYVSANMDFLGDSHDDIALIMESVTELLEAKEENSFAQSRKKLMGIVDEVDWPYLKEEVPSAIKQSKEGLRRITNIVVAMKHFSHPSGDTPELSNINAAIENTVAVAKNEWKYVADMELQLDPALPEVPCFLDALNQVFLSMIVNGTHAIEEKLGKNAEGKGKITITTESKKEEVLISISDDGIGMPASVKEKIFDPFYTTKELNKGTGQGLAIAHDVVTQKHNGRIAVNSEDGEGTRFIITLPLGVSKHN